MKEMMQLGKIMCFILLFSFQITKLFSSYSDTINMIIKQSLLPKFNCLIV